MTYSPCDIVLTSLMRKHIPSTIARKMCARVVCWLSPINSLQCVMQQVTLLHLSASVEHTIR